jgi:hypothetical protein
MRAFKSSVVKRISSGVAAVSIALWLAVAPTDLAPNSLNVLRIPR